MDEKLDLLEATKGIKYKGFGKERPGCQTVVVWKEGRKEETEEITLSGAAGLHHFQGLTMEHDRSHMHANFG